MLSLRRRTTYFFFMLLLLSGLIQSVTLAQDTPEPPPPTSTPLPTETPPPPPTTPPTLPPTIVPTLPPTSTFIPTNTLSPTELPTLTNTETPLPTATTEITPTPTFTEALIATIEASPSLTLPPSPTVETTVTPTVENTPSATVTLENTPPMSLTPTLTPTGSETPTVTATTSATATATVTTTPTVSPTETVLTLLYADNFDSGDLSNWTVGAGWSLVSNGDGQAMQVSNSTTPLTYNDVVAADVSVNLDLLLDNETFEIRLRDSLNSAYVVTIYATGQIAVHHEQMLIASGLTSLWNSGEWRSLDVSLVGDVLKVIINMEEVVVVNITNEQRIFVPGFSQDGMGLSLIDNLEIWTVYTSDISYIAIEGSSPELPIEAVPSGFTRQSTNIQFYQDFSGSIGTPNVEMDFQFGGEHAVYQDFNADRITASLGTGQGVQVRLEADFQLGDGDETYTVSDLHLGTHYYARPDYFYIGASNEIVISMYDANDNLVYGPVVTCIYSIGGAIPSECTDADMSGSVLNVKTIRVIHQTVHSTYTYYNSTFAYRLSISSLRVTAQEQIIIEPTPTPTATPLADWPHDGISILPDTVIPNISDESLLNQALDCDRSFAPDDLRSQAFRVPCAVRTFQDYYTYFNSQGIDFTWSHLVSILYHLEGGVILRGSLDANNQTILGNPGLAQGGSPREGVCHWLNRNPFNHSWFYVIMEVEGLGQVGYGPTRSFESGSDFCDELQSNFVYAMLEQIHNLCARANYTSYTGNCSQERLVDFLAGIQAWYADHSVWLGNGQFANRSQVVDEAMVYFTLAVDQINQFSYTGSRNPYWGICPCNWGNVGTEIDAQTGNPGPPRNTPDHAGRTVNNSDGIPILHPTRYYSYSYLYYDETRAEGGFRYFKVG